VGNTAHVENRVKGDMNSSGSRQDPRIRVSKDENTFCLFLVYLINRSIAQNIASNNRQDRGRSTAGIEGS
jgi:hypothetical protein